MRAVLFEKFGELPEVQAVDDPAPTPDGVVVAVEATGVCRSDWHAWRGHDSDVKLPHIPGHELAGTVVAVGERVRNHRVGERVTVPFVCACGTCPRCASGNQQICDHQFQPGFTGWGSFAEFVALDHADVNLVPLPADLEPVTAAALGCRFGTAYRAVLRQGALQAGEWVTVYGCGGAGLSAVLLAVAAGARVVAVDLSPDALTMAKRLGAEATVHSRNPVDEVRELTEGGAHLSLDCVGLPVTCASSVAGLRKHGRHVQVGLMPPGQGTPPIPMHRVIADELRILGSHGLQAHEYPAMLDFVARSGMDLGQLVGRRIGLDDAPAALAEMDEPVPVRAGVTVVDLPRP
ncbi:zinc-dependent alcohol dehydrogenase family protein [Amycolatopsis acidiphila]|uniref:Zinc-dependent alcohol dehydrogenase family protein n=1 Tax=Amycolatopsis acidiphila TaxID=715473 RepID=A0A557ZQ86_9PSEU|nr:zinc-dependent alcohol dehydrogenase family protein [Amycolatopsis acidiphila]TVT14160.1 zinc-dependent alcohol dehydrogenase family protein [Amycolatopsis acidiphila]UIJ59236.1 zinc-dependent alcohol dehydrogenase family protein [Amycolatopsis acidiphila]GHG79287.1 alcohol dehydrogenase [Amycolatopsis acidiphila]